MPAIPDVLPAEARVIGERLKEALGAERIYLFGSHARGTAGPDSDLDFLVVVPSSTKTRYERAVDALRSIRGFGGASDIIVLTRTEWEKELKAPCSLSSTVLREGIPLHQ